MNRRQAIKALGSLMGAAATVPHWTGCDTEDEAPGIDTLVFMMMENRSYDHYLGSRSLLEGLPGDGLVAGMFNPDLNDQAVEIQPTTEETMCLVDPPHSWTASRDQFNGGANDGFLKAYQRSHGGDARGSMQYLSRDQLPVIHALADAYTICDRWFCSVLGPTLPNRMYWYGGTSNGATNNSEVLNGAFEGLPSIFHLLESAEIEWAYYYGDAPMLAVIKDIPIAHRLKRYMYDFIDDAAAGRLPPVVFVDPAFGANDDHPPHHPLLGQQLIAATYQALATSPHWERCQFLLTYDEHGGFFDHVPPPKAPDSRAAEGFDQLGFRVPALLIGPYAKQGYISSVQYDHTSALKHLENALGLPALTARSAAANDLTDCIDLQRFAEGRPSAAVQLPAVEIDETQLPESCRYNFSLSTDHDFLRWVDGNNLGVLDRRGHINEYIYGIAEYLDHHNLGRIRRR